MIGKLDGLVSVIPGVLKTNDVVRMNVPPAIAAPSASQPNISDPPRTQQQYIGITRLEAKRFAESLAGIAFVMAINTL